MIQTKYVLVKGCYGMGGRIAVLLTALHYAEITKRVLVVDWNDGMYSPKGSTQDAYSLYFKKPTNAINEFYSLASSNKLSIYPNAWENQLLSISNNPVETRSLYFHQPPENDVQEDVVVITRPKKPNNQIGGYKKYIDRLQLSEKIAREVDRLWSENAMDDNAIGVHIRHGNGEAGVVAPNLAWFINEVNDARKTRNGRIFFASDSLNAQLAFMSLINDAWCVQKIFPKAGPLHNRNSNDLQVIENGEKAIIDLILLSKCKRLVLTGHYFSQFAVLFGGGSEMHKNYPKGNCRHINREIHQMGLFDIKDNYTLWFALTENGIQTNCIYYRKSGNDSNVLEIFYGSEFIASVLEDPNMENLNTLKVKLLARRLYV